MASYKIFEPILLKQEGGYCNKPHDSGGETWMGIARNYYPNSKIWPIIDANKSQLPSNDNHGWGIFSKFLRTLPNLQLIVDSFYETEFWDEMKGDQINNQSIANFIGDWGVNAGLSIPIKHAQQILSINDDGKMGPQTLSAINSADGQSFFTQLQHARFDFYHAVVARHPEDQEFMSDWIKRTNSFSYSPN